MKKRIICLLIVAVLGLTGCGATYAGLIESYENKVASIKEELNKRQNVDGQSVITYEEDPDLEKLTMELPKVNSKIMIDLTGYEQLRTKNAVIVNAKKDSSFKIVDIATKQVVFEGKIESSSDENILKGDFSDLEIAGDYYIETDDVGRSEIFSINENSYSELFAEICKIDFGNEIEPSVENLIDAAEYIHISMMALKCHGYSFENDENNVYISRVMKVAEWLLSNQDKSGSVLEDYEATAAFVTATVLCAENFGKYESNISQNYRYAATRAWRWLERQGLQTDAGFKSARFYAATAMFYMDKATNYKKIIDEFLKSNSDEVIDNPYVFLGSCLYLDTPAKADRDICTAIMQRLVKETENICVLGKENACYVYSDDVEQCMSKMLLICFVDYVTPSEEYVVVLENMLHYLLGRNELGKRYIHEDYTLDESISSSQFTNYAILTYLLSDLNDKDK